MENLESTQVLNFVRDTWTQISNSLTGTDGTNKWRGTSCSAGRYAHEVRAITAGPPPTTGNPGGTTRVRYGFFG